MSEGRGSESLVAFLIGAAAGAIAGVIFAPRPGKETRQKIGRWIEDVKEKGEEILEESKERLTTKKEQVSAAIEAGREAYRKTGKNAD